MSTLFWGCGCYAVDGLRPAWCKDDGYAESVGNVFDEVWSRWVSLPQFSGRDRAALGS